MGAKQKTVVAAFFERRGATWRRVLWAIVTIFPLLAALGWSSAPAVSAVLATRTLGTINVPAAMDEQGMIDLRRQIQKHFLVFGLYLPVEDIISSNRSDSPSSESMVSLMRKACGRGTLYVWVPVRFRLPVVGEKVMEWCWKPSTKILK